ncbi:uncharacterized protein GIQ15_02509 [Arthroderma uncinatum]|uniref:uncharacterized protein n=1 Tax=Arthroderma uncinatum TaxID=74035 RepID=UPI00144A8FFC|nr:uncharacterized protein GIQ15_02509 [Arthroderma uncinatum]KAF3483185.1 hypothetical protein GIQ15_02509 [Arthroderma uncinatum]
MGPVTNQMLNARKEKDCIAYTTERKFFDDGQTFIKRSLRPSEWQLNPYTGTIMIPKLGNERLLNEAAAMKFIAENTNIPIPKLLCCFEDDEAIYLIIEKVNGIELSKLEESKRKIVEKEVEIHLQTLHDLKSKTWGGPTGLVLPPYRVMRKSHRLQWTMKPRETEDLVFCHNDMSTHNIIVDPETLKIRAILDWEYAGFFPPEFEGAFYKRPGPSVALKGEEDDVDTLMDIMHENEVLFGEEADTDIRTEAAP